MELFSTTDHRIVSLLLSASLYGVLGTVSSTTVSELGCLDEDVVVVVFAKWTSCFVLNGRHLGSMYDSYIRCLGEFPSRL